jgi:hypothetical protein
MIVRLGRICRVSRVSRVGRIKVNLQQLVFFIVAAVELNLGKRKGVKVEAKGKRQRGKRRIVGGVQGKRQAVQGEKYAEGREQVRTIELIIGESMVI